jgi:hypothetical protein
MFTIAFGVIIVLICLIGLWEADAPFQGIIFGPGFLIGCAIIVVGVLDYVF